LPTSLNGAAAKWRRPPASPSVRSVPRSRPPDRPRAIPCAAAIRGCRPTRSAAAPSGVTTGLRDLKLWQESVALSGEAVRAARDATRRETRAATDEIVRTALAAAVAIADGYARESPPDQRASLQEARRALAALETVLAVARHAGILPASIVAPLGVRATNVGKLLAGYAMFVARQMESEAREEGRATPAPR
jgi:four helix bundle protein